MCRILEHPRLRDTARVPDEGWRFRVPETGAELSSQTFHGLVRLVRLHREANAINLSLYDATAREIEAQICQRHPGLAR